MMFSTVIYILKACGIIQNTTWCTEIYGFIWGIILFYIKDKIIVFCNKAWVAKCIVLCLIAVLLGVTYLKMKTVAFFGDYLLKIVLGLAIIFFILLLNAKINIGNRMSTYLGNISFEVYLLHGKVFGLVAFLNASTQSSMFILISIVITVFASWITYNLSRIMIKEMNYR